MSLQPALDSGFGTGWSCNINEGRHLGKTVGQFMCHKFFHPDSKKNLIILGFRRFLIKSIEIGNPSSRQLKNRTSV